MKRLLVTGGAGFIGSTFIRLFLESHPQAFVINLDKLTYAGNLMNLRLVEENPRYRFVRGDIADKRTVQDCMRQVDAVINFAAETHVDRSIHNPEAFIVTNYNGVHTLLEAAREAGVQRFLQVSTDEVYGSIVKGSFSEDSRLNPSNPYSASKAAADLLVRSYWITYGLRTLIVRSTNNFGPHQYPEKVIPLFITHLLEDKKVPLYAMGENMRDWLFVEDNCRGIDFVLENGEPGEIYNIAGGNEMSNRTLTRHILSSLGKDEEFIQRVADRPGHDFRYSVDGTKLTKLGFSPQAFFEAALKDTVNWYREHELWWKPLKNNAYTGK
jgi:dTDP-glucose 4,6-dehydratase